MVSREEAFLLLQKYNKEPFHIQHGVVVEGVMRYFAREMGYEKEEEFWGIVGLLHDVDYEMYPDEHCKKAPQLLKEINAPEEMVRAIVSHAYGICSDVQPIHKMEKILYATDELTGLIGAVALMRPSKSCKDMELKSLKKKFKDKKFAAKCDRGVMVNGANMLDWQIDELLSKTLEAMKTLENV